MAIKLYQSRISPNARKVRLIAAELGIPLEIVVLDLLQGRTPDYLAKNPNGRVPTIDDDGFLLWESGAILRYLAAKRPEKGLLPRDPKPSALADQWLLWWTAHPEAALWTLAQEKLLKPRLGLGGNDPVLIASAERELARFIPVLDAHLNGREFIVDALTVVDFAPAPWLEAATRLGVDLTPYSNVASWLGRLQSKPYWKET
jgi:glutathione S-transferase